MPQQLRLPTSDPAPDHTLGWRINWFLAPVHNPGTALGMSQMLRPQVSYRQRFVEVFFPYVNIVRWCLAQLGETPVVATVPQVAGGVDRDRRRTAIRSGKVWAGEGDINGGGSG